MMHYIARGICIKNNAILLAYHKDKSYYFLPGGHIEPGESGHQTVLREFKEETNEDVSVISFVTTLEHVWESKNEIQHEINLIFLVALNKQDVGSCVEHLTFKWVPITQFNETHFLPAELKPYLNNLLINEPIPQFISTIHKA